VGCRLGGAETERPRVVRACRCVRELAGETMVRDTASRSRAVTGKLATHAVARADLVDRDVDAGKDSDDQARQGDARQQAAAVRAGVLADETVACECDVIDGR
jgi:hypothetical protein